jgi:hypothetical protein
MDKAADFTERNDGQVQNTEKNLHWMIGQETPRIPSVQDHLDARGHVSG